MNLKINIAVLVSVFVTATSSFALESPSGREQKLVFVSMNMTMPVNGERLVRQAILLATLEADEAFIKYGGPLLDDPQEDGLNSVVFVTSDSLAGTMPKIETQQYFVQPGQIEFDITITAGPAAEFDDAFVTKLKRELKKQLR